MSVGLEPELYVVNKAKLVVWVRNNVWSTSLGQLTGNSLYKTGHDLGDYVTRKYRLGRKS